MNRLGNLDNLSFGMGLGRAKPGQYIPAKNANFDGFDGSSKVGIGVVVLLAIITLFFWKKKSEVAADV
jgi:hypothetical protein